MRVERLHIDGFGHFNGTDLGPFDGKIVVFQGANEAGKSTLLAFIQTILFGFGRRPGRTEVPALAGGEHGGRIVAVDDEGRRIIIGRRTGPHGGQATLSMPDGSTGGQSELNRLLGFPAEVYCNVFSFDLEQLFAASSLENEDIRTHLYGAGLGTENLPAALRALDQRAGEIFSARGRVQHVPTLLNTIQDLDRKLDAAARDSEKYHDHRARLETIDSDRETIRQQIAGLRRDQQHNNNLLHALDDWVALLAVEARLADLPEIESYPEEGVTRLADFDTRIQSAEVEERRVRQTADGLQTALDAPLPDAALDSCRQDIEQVRSQLDSFNTWVERQPRIAADASTLQKQIDEGLAELGPDWTATRLQAFDTSIPERDTVSAHNTALETARLAVRDAERDVEVATTEHRSAATTFTDAQQGLQSARVLAGNQDELDIWQQHHREARAALAEFNATKQAYDEHQRMAAYGPATPAKSGGGFVRSCSMVAAGGLMIFGALAALIGIASGGAAMGGGLIVGGLALALGIILLLRGLRPPPVVEQAAAEPQNILQRAQAEYERSRQRARDAFDRLGVTDASQAASALDDIQERITATRSVLQQVDAASAQVRLRKSNLDGEQSKLDRARQDLNTAWNEWRDWLTARNLSEDLSPGAVLAIFSRVSQLRQQQERLQAVIQEQRDLAGQIDRFRKRYERIVHALDESRTANVLEIGADARLLIERYETLRTEIERRNGVQEQLHAVHAEHEQRLAGLADLRRQRAELIALGGTDDAEIFRTRARQYAERQEAGLTRQENLARLQRNSSTDADWQRLRHELDAATAEELTDQIADLQRQQEDLEEELSAFDHERGEISQEMSRLASDETAIALRAERQVAEEQLREYASEWTTYSVAREILARARQRYEQERQPEVLQTAERFFRSITARRYTGVISPVGSNKIEVVRFDELRLSEGQLSRGTREQLYLALRFGLIAGFGRTSAHLPVIVDDILVNFDPARARATAEAFVELSQTNQILVFTCHPSTVEHFRAVSSGVQVVNLQPEAMTMM